MIFDRATIKSKLITAHQSKFTDAEKFPNCELDAVAEVFLQLIERDKLTDLTEALQIFYVERNADKFSNARNKLAHLIEHYFKRVFKSAEGIEIDGELATCLHHFFDGNKECRLLPFCQQ